MIGCQKDEPFGPVLLAHEDSLKVALGQRLIVGCEGNFQFNNASLYEINLETGSVNSNVFARSNEPLLGDVLQDIKHRNDTLFIVLNNSGLVRLLNDSTFKEIDVIDGLISPRYALVVGHYFWVTDLYSNIISIYDLRSLILTRTIKSNGWTERILHHNGSVYVANVDLKKIMVYSLDGVLKDEQTLEIEPNYFFLTHQGFIVANGNIAEIQNSTIKVLDFNLSEVKILKYDETIRAITTSGDKVFVALDSDVQILKANDLSELDSFTTNVQTIYSMMADSARNELYIMDAKDFISNGEVMQYSISDQQLLGKYQVGVIPQASLIAL